MFRFRSPASVKRLGALAVVCGLVVGLTPAVADVARAEEPPLQRVLVVSDSSLAAMRWYASTQGALKGADFTLDLESCRRLQGTSCTGREGRKPPTVLDVVNAAAPGYDTLVVFAGYNDAANSFSKGFDLIVQTARERGITRILWTTLRVDVDYVSPGNFSSDGTFKSNNKVLRQKLATGNYADVTVADWDRYTVAETAWFATDGVHFTVIGAWGAADYLTRKLAFMDGRPCPTPRRSGEEVQTPCPDPDLGPPDVDLVSLYPIDPNALHCYEVGEERRIECRPDILAHTITATLRYAMHGGEVKALQKRLIRLGDLGGVADGAFGKRTLQAVMNFQKRKRLPITGAAGPATRAALGFGCPELALASGIPCPPDGEVPYLLPTLRYGHSGAQVTSLQRRLIELGILASTADGRFLTRTRAAVRAFQRTNGLRVTGVVDGPTASTLGFIVPGPSAPP